MKEPDLSQDAVWKQRYRAWTVVAAAVASRMPERGVATANRTGVQQIYAWDVPSGELRQLTFSDAGKVAASISPDGRYVYYLNDEQGNEIGHVARVPFEGGDIEDVTPDMPPFALSGLAFSDDGTRLALTAATRDGLQTYISELDASGGVGQLRPLFQTTALMRGLFLSRDGGLAVLGLTERSGTTDGDLVAVETETGERLGELFDDGASVMGVRFSRVAGDERIVCETTRSGVSRPIVWDARRGERTDLDFADIEGEVFVSDWSEEGRTLLLMQVNQAVQRLARYDLEKGELSWLNHPSGTIIGAHFAPDGAIYALINDSTQPARVVALDGLSGAERSVLLTGEVAPPATSWRSATYPSTAGARIQAWVATPDGEGPFPTILVPHGGPSAAMMETFSPRMQAFIDHGFAYVAMNYRGSTTFGREFQNAILGELGRWEIDDIAAAYRWAVDNNVADPGQVFLMGGSYGGYLTLLGLGRLPDLFAGGIALVAIADWRLMYEDQAETLRRYQVALFKGTPDQKPDEHDRASPISYAQDVRAPLLVIQGSNDTRCPSRQMQVYGEKMLELGKDIEIVWFDAGHGSYSIEQNIEHTEKMLAFAHRVLMETS